MANEKATTTTCWICNSTNLHLVKKSDITENLNSDNFAITNSDYGKTGELSKCADCGFIQCTDKTDVIQFYEDLEDHEYEKTRNERAIQERKLVQMIKEIKPEGRFLDIGAGSGIMVEEALKLGYDAIGVEPSKWLQNIAVKRGLPIHLGVFPSEEITGKFDVIALVDVIEHVNNPVELIQEISKALKEDGVLMVITPNVKSFVAKSLKWKWWHFRIAHIGYFDPKTLELLGENAGLKIVKRKKPAWYFRVEYLVKRVHHYLPKFLRIPLPSFLNEKVIPLNLRDSLCYLYKIDKN
jgi:SAM-dependent methyltransferase